MQFLCRIFRAFLSQRAASGAAGAVFTAALLTSVGANLSPARAAVWTATQEWSDAWEARFSEWVLEEWSKDYFTDSSRPLTFGLELDCADAVYAMRILFAYEHDLPFAINDPRRGGRKITNEMTQWDNFRPRLREELDDGGWRTYRGEPFDETQKVRALIDFVSDVTSTRTLANDTYPIALDDIRSGDMFLVPGSHAYMVSRVEPTGAMTTLSASSPRAWRAFAEIRDFPAHVPTDQRRKRDGYRRFKPIAELRTRSLRISGASTQQWDAAQSVEGDPAAFGLLTQSALAEQQEPMWSRADRAFFTLCDYLRQRAQVVQEARQKVLRMEQDESRACMSIYEYNEYSTPTRDTRLLGQFRAMRALTTLPEWTAEPFYLKDAVEYVFAPEGAYVDAPMLDGLCRVDIDFMSGRHMNVRQVWLALSAGLMADDPHAPLEHRWGIAGDAWEPQCQVAKSE